MQNEPIVNRELSWLEFNARVLEEAVDSAVPLLERVKFLAIFSSNLDEFFMVRYAGIWRQIDAGVLLPGPDGLLPRKVLEAVSRRVHAMVAEQHRAFLSVILPELRKHGVRLFRAEELDASHRAVVNDIFEQEILPLLTPMAIDPGHPFPYLANRAICLVAELEPLDPDEETSGDVRGEFGGRGERGSRADFGSLPQAKVCVLHTPAGIIPRFIRLPAPEGQHHAQLLEDAIRSHAARLFTGYRVASCTAIRVTRDAELDLAGDPAEDLLSTIEDAVRNRRMGAAVRLQYERRLPQNILDTLVKELELEPADLYPSDGPTGLTDLIQLYAALDIRELRDPVWQPAPEPDLEGTDIFTAIRTRDVLVHHPYQDFACVHRFVQAAAEDPDVLAIKMTLYRVSGDSPIGQALEHAVRMGKEVAVLVELRARFSEEANIAWARRLEAQGAHVVYGIGGFKTHCKATMVVRREREGGSGKGGRTVLRRYCHLGTGNYNHQSARLYTDLGLFTCRAGFGEDLTHLFNLLTGYVQPPPFQHLVLAPTQMCNWIIAAVRREAEAAQAGRPSGITAKLNAVADPRVIHEMYRASQAGVKIQLIIRGICCRRPGVPGLSENIRVIRIVDRYLEHARVYKFECGGAPEYHLSSADWMPRNLNGRIEITFPLLDPAHRRRVQEILDIQLADTQKARELQPDGSSERIPCTVGEPVRAQERLMLVTRARGKEARQAERNDDPGSFFKSLA